MKNLRRRLAGPEIPTSSMADIAFLLIIFFMVTAVFSATKGLELTLSEEDAEGGEQDPGVLVPGRDTPYSRVVEVYDTLVQGDTANISFPTSSEIDSYVKTFGFNPFEARCGGEAE